MGKGVSGLQNIQFLKWCKEYGIRPYWNFLWGVPGEDSMEYARMSALIPFVTHLPAPQAVGCMRLDRFSPNFVSAESRGFSELQPYPSYQHIYPFPPAVVTNLARYFTYSYAAPQDVHEYVPHFECQVRRWQEVQPTSDLISVDDGQHLLIWDLRDAIEGGQLTVLKGQQRLVYLTCDRIATRARLERIAVAVNVESTLRALVRSGLMISDGDSYLALAIPLGYYSPNERVIAKLRVLLEQLKGRRKDGTLHVADFELRGPGPWPTGAHVRHAVRSSQQMSSAGEHFSRTSAT